MTRSLKFLGAVLLLSTLQHHAAVAGEEGLQSAARAVEAGRLEPALGELRRAFEKGYATPSKIHVDPRFADLRRDAAAREAWRELMRQFVRETRIDIAPEDEAGRRMIVRGRVVSADRAVAGATVYLYHADATGNYAPNTPVGQGSNPRLFAFVRTEGDGSFEVRTIEPSSYPGASAPSAHVHYRVEADGFGERTDQFHPYTSPADPSKHASTLKSGRPTTRVHEKDGTLICEVTIPLQPK